MSLLVWFGFFHRDMEWLCIFNYISAILTFCSESSIQCWRVCVWAPGTGKLNRANWRFCSNFIMMMMIFATVAMKFWIRWICMLLAPFQMCRDISLLGVGVYRLEMQAEVLVGATNTDTVQILMLYRMPCEAVRRTASSFQTQLCVNTCQHNHSVLLGLSLHSALGLS